MQPWMRISLTDSNCLTIYLLFVSQRKLPQVSVIVPVYNRADLLNECLSSVAEQSFENWECIVVDDGSDDASLGVARAFAEEDGRFRPCLRTSPRKGASVCRNEGLGAAQGEYVVFLDSDDLLHPDCLLNRVSFMEDKGAELDFAVFPTLTFSEYPGDSDILWNIHKPLPDLLRFLRLDSAWSITGPIWRTSAIREIGAFDENLPGWQDWQLHVLALLKNLKYTWCALSADAYCRKQGSGQIGNMAGSIQHIEAKTRFLLKLLAGQSESLLGDEALRAASVGLVWYQVIQLECAGRRAGALHYWRSLYRLGYVSRRIWLEGALALMWHGKAGGSLFWQRVKEWPKERVLPVDRSTCHSVRLESHLLKQTSVPKGCWP